MTVERSELETCQRLNKKIDQLEAELVSAKTKLEQEVAQKHKLGRSMDVRSVAYSHCMVFCVTNQITQSCILYTAVSSDYWLLDVLAFIFKHHNWMKPGTAYHLSTISP